MRKFIIAALLVILAIPVFAGKAATLKEVQRPFYVAVDKDQMYIVDNNIIRHYSLPEFKHVKVIGKKGAGPGEFPFSPSVHVFPDTLFVNSWGKIMFFGRDGTFLSEKRLSFPVSYFAYPILPLGKEGFVGPNYKMGKTDISFSIHDKDLNVVKELSSGMPNVRPIVPPGGGPKRDLDWIGQCWSYTVYGDKIFVANTRKGFYFSVFDFSGKKLYEINHPYDKAEVDKDAKEALMKRLEGMRGWDKNKQFFNVIIRDEFPAFACFKIADDKIYVYTYKKKDGKYEIVIMDLKGKILKRAYAKHSLPNSRGFVNQLSISKGVVYYLREDFEKEAWDLYTDKIE